MAKIFISFCNFFLIRTGRAEKYPLIESIIEGLVSSGNDVFCFMHTYQKHGFEQEIDPLLKERVKNFNPDLAILLNGNFWDMSFLPDTKILIYDIDNPQVFSLPDVIKSYGERCYFGFHQELSRQMLIDIYNPSSNNMLLFTRFTEVRPEKRNIERNIGFVGTSWLPGGGMKPSQIQI